MPRARVAPALLALVLLCSCLYMCTSPGRITYPDDEIVFQTTESMVVDHDLSIPGIAKRTGERPDRPTGTFGWATGRDGRRYGFFGHALSIVAIPFYAVADATVDHVPELWRFAVRSDLFTFHKRSLDADWHRLIVSLTNCLLTPLGAVLLGLWLSALGHRPRVAVGCALIYALGTTAWPYAGTFLSEPLSVVVLLGAALAITRWRQTGRAAQLWIAASLAGWSVHVHVLNLVAIPCLLGYALGVGEGSSEGPRSPADAGSSREGGTALTALRRRWAEHRRDWHVAMLLGALGLVALGLTQWWRFGSPFETGRYDDYGHWVWPLQGLVAILVAPGRSLLWYSPPLLLALWAWPSLRRRDGATAYLVVGLALTRALLVTCRSDWHGGWAIGPRYLVPVVPFLIVPLATWLDDWSQRTRLVRSLAVALFAGSAAVQAYLASHSVFQLFWELNREYGMDRYMFVSDWYPKATPVVVFWQQQQPALEFWRGGNLHAAIVAAQFDALWFGAWRLGRMTEADGLWSIMIGLGVSASLAAAALVWWWAAQRSTRAT